MIDHDPRPPMTEAQREAYRATRYKAPALWQGGPEAWRCVCGLEHRDPWSCLNAAELRAWRAKYPEATCGDKAARALAWMERTFRR